MPQIAYFDCFSGISGDMILGALIDVGLDLDVLRRELARLPLEPYHLESKREKRGQITGTRVRVITQEAPAQQRSWSEIKQLIAASTLSPWVKETSIEVLRRIARAEAKLHGMELAEVHFHEIGAVDSLVDVVGTCIGMELLNIQRSYSSPLPLGHGCIQSTHGLLPLPAPATLELLKNVPVYDGSQARELVTPTGAAILTTLCCRFGGFPKMAVDCIGYGVGKHPADHPPNMLRLVTGHELSSLVSETLLLLETNVDDMNPEIYSYLMSRLLEAGALDVCMVPTFMKKNRPGQLLQILSPAGVQHALVDILLNETSSLGVRLSRVERLSLPRRIIRVATSYGRIAVKVAENPAGYTKVAPEYEDCRRAAARHQVPLLQVYDEAVCRARARLAKEEPH
ncbi:MAG: nickel pincer cofactor biosynthesis protein LarC [Deltaproteobacteria bacterium]|nr:nickel pincer cofactor biosynthesis protein LarC [Deltaproteobacteria bacterium]MBW2070390.1 nickel pincer cofactor biosynthesis protein LarC [Deltaproteobacteria bacterium]